MTATPQALRIEGIYPQRQKGFFMQRVKLPAGMISAQQARTVAQIAERYARGVVHLTVRESMELHWLTEGDLTTVARQLASVGLVSRGACGGAVRGVVCGSLGCGGTPALEALARRIHRHFTANPRFEGLPKKFKVAIEADVAGRRHLIQDIGLVASAAAENCYDVYAAGGLGREPVPAFLLAQGVPEGRLIPLIETVVRVYRAQTPAGKRLKYLVAQIGREEFSRQVLSDPAASEELPALVTHFDTLVPEVPDASRRLEVEIFAGELRAAELSAFAEIAERFAGGMLMITVGQNVALHLDPECDPDKVLAELSAAGVERRLQREEVSFRVCPGNHECIMGLAPTRDVAAELLKEMGPEARGKSWAISGCPNSCSQPQLAEVGVVAARLGKGEGREPLFMLYRGGEGVFAVAERSDLSREELLEAVREIG